MTTRVYPGQYACSDVGYVDDEGNICGPHSDACNGFVEQDGTVRKNSRWGEAIGWYDDSGRVYEGGRLVGLVDENGLVYDDESKYFAIARVEGDWPYAAAAAYLLIFRPFV